MCRKKRVFASLTAAHFATLLLFFFRQYLFKKKKVLARRRRYVSLRFVLCVCFSYLRQSIVHLTAVRHSAVTRHARL